MGSRYDESSMSSLSAAQSAYNAAEPKPLSSASVRSRQSNARSTSGRSSQQPRSVDGRSAQSVASALSHGSAGRGRRLEEDERSSNTMNLIGQVNDMAGSYYSKQPSRDPDSHSVRSNPPPPPPRSVRSSNSNRRYDPDGMSHEYGADDPDGLHYAPGIRNHTQVPSVRGPPSIASRTYDSRNSRSYYTEDQSTLREEDESYYSQSVASSRASSRGGRSQMTPRLSAEASMFSGGGEDNESYYSRDSRGSRSMVSSKKVSEKKFALLFVDIVGAVLALWNESTLCAQIHAYSYFQPHTQRNLTQY